MQVPGILWLIALMPVFSGCAAVSVAGVLASAGASTAVRAIDNQMQENAMEAPYRAQVAEANLNVAIEQLRRGNYEDAIARLDRAKEAYPKYSFIYSVYGLVYQRIGDNEQAEKYFLQSLKLDEAPENLNNYGQFLCQQGRADEAEKQFLKATKNRLYNTPEIALTNAGLCAQRGGNIAKATEYFQAALRANPNAPAALIAMGDIELANDRIEEAYKLLTNYLKVAPHSPRSLWLGIRIADKRGDKDTEASYEMLLRNKFPDSVEAGNLKSSANKPQG